jgi:hypothetical protein
MPFELESQGVHMVPVKGRFIKAGRAHEMVGNACQLGAWENAEGLHPDVVERRRVGNLVVRKQGEDVPGLLQRVIALQAGGIHAVFRDGLGLLHIAPDMIHEASDQMVMKTLIPLEDKTEQIEVRGPNLANTDSVG